MKKRYELRPHPDYGFLQIHPTPSPEEITQFYTEEFYESYPRFNDSALDVQVKDEEWLNARRAEICETIKALKGRLEGLSLLDIGCGWGHALMYFERQGLHGFGFDPVTDAIEHGRSKGLNVVAAGMERMDVFEDRRFEVACLFNVLEHLADPVQVLAQIREKVLAVDGILVIDVPNEFNPLQLCANELFKLDEWWVAPPGHLNYFSADTLRRLVEGSGFEVQLCEASFPMEMFLLFGDNYVRDSQLGGACHERRIAFENNLRRTGRGALLRKLYQSLATLNIGRQVTVIARKM